MVGWSRRGQHPPAAVHRGDRDVEQPGHPFGHLVQPAARQHHLHQRPVRLLGAGQHGRLPVEDVGEHLVEDVVEADVVGQQDQREAEPVGLLHHLAGQLVDVAAELDGQRREAPLVQVGHQAAERLRRVAQRVAGGEQQLVRLDPGQDVGHLHDVEALHDAAQPALPRDQPRLREGGHAEHLPHGHAVDDRARTRQPDGGFHGVDSDPGGGLSGRANLLAHCWQISPYGGLKGRSTVRSRRDEEAR